MKMAENKYKELSLEFADKRAKQVSDIQGTIRNIIGVFTNNSQT